MTALAILAAAFAGMLGGLALSYGLFARRSRFRRFMRWLGPTWALVCFWYATVWVAAAIQPGYQDVTRWLRPVAWLAFAIPSLVLFGALREDTRHLDEEQQAKQAIQAIAADLERRRNGEP
jgi:hypothetical protein